MWLLTFLAGVLFAAAGFALVSWQRPADVVQADHSLGEQSLPEFVAEPPVMFRKAERPARPHPATGTPLVLRVPQLGVDVPVVKIDVTDGILVPPDNPQTLGWWSGGARPGALSGGALITGHTVSSGGGAFDDLDTLRTGDRVAVRTRKGMIRYVVSAVSVYRKASLARHAGKVFDQSVPGRLVLVTCEDWDGEKYLSNAVVLANPLRRSW